MQKTPSTANRWFWFAVKLAVSLLLLVWLVGKFELSAASLAPLSYGPLLVALAATCVTIVAGAGRWQIILGMYSQRLPFLETFRIQYVSAFMAQFLPGFVGPDAVKAYMATRRGVRLATSIASVMLERGLSVLGLVLIVIAASPRVLEVVKDDRLQLVLLGFSAATLVGTAVLIGFAGQLNRGAERLSWLSPIALLASGLLDLARNTRSLALVLAGTMLIHLMYAVSLWAALAAFGEPPVFWDVIAVFAPVVLFQMLPVSFGGWGVRELAVVTMLAAVGVSGTQALAASIVLGIVQMIACLPGSAAWFIRVDAATGPDLRSG
jgi:uncharacterized membrane protein YbhN (UPF0104 family)